MTEHNLMPFVDGSIRREPDFEHDYPAITCLCRGGNFTPRLAVGDVVAYVTKKVRLEGDHYPSRRLTAILNVTLMCPNHEIAAQWYAVRRLEVPNNCIVTGNNPKPLCESHRRFRKITLEIGDVIGHRKWGRSYVHRSKKHPEVAICTPLFINIGPDAPILTDDSLNNAFGRIPGTRNPGVLPEKSFMKMVRILRIELPSFQ